MEQQLLQPDLNPRDFIENLSRKILFNQQQLQIQQHLEEDSEAVRRGEFEYSTPFVTAFDQSFALIQQLSASVDQQIQKVTEESNDALLHHFSTLSHLSNTFQENVEKFKNVDKRVYNVGNTAIRIGDRLDALDQQRSRISEIKSILDAFIDLNNSTSGGGTSSSTDSSIWTDDSKIHDRAMLIKRLNSIVSDLESDHSKTTALKGDIIRCEENDEDILGNDRNKKKQLSVKKMSVGKAKVEEYSNMIENMLLRRFESAANEHNIQAMKETAFTLYSFNGGASCVTTYIAKLNMFFNPDYDHLDRELARLLDGVGIAQHNNKPTVDRRSSLFVDTFLQRTEEIEIAYKRREQQLEEYFDDILETCKREREVIEAVFPNPAHVMSLLISRLFEQRIGNFIDGLLTPTTNTKNKGADSAKNTNSKKAGTVNGDNQMFDDNDAVAGLIYLRTLSHVLKLCENLVKSLQSSAILQPDSFNPESTLLSLFSLYKQDYFERETKTMIALYSIYLPQRQAELEGLIMKWTEKALFFIRRNEEAVARTLSIFPPSSSSLDYTAQYIHRYFTILLNYLGYQFLAFNLDRELDRLKQAVSSEKGRNANSTYLSFLLEATTTETVSSTTKKKEIAAMSIDEKAELLFPFLELVQQINQIILLIQNYFFTTIIGKLEGSINDKTQSVLEMNTFISQLEHSISVAFHLILSLVMTKVENILSTEQKKDDFKSHRLQSEEGIVPQLSTTSACVRVLAFMKLVSDAIHNTLDGKNLRRFLDLICVRLHSTLLNHFKSVSISTGIGGLKLMRDVSEYQEFVKKTLSGSPHVVQQFELLRDIAKIFIVNASELKSLINNSSLATLLSASPSSGGPFAKTNISRGDILSFIKQRPDFKPTWLDFL